MNISGTIVYKKTYQTLTLTADQIQRLKNADISKLWWILPLVLIFTMLIFCITAPNVDAEKKMAYLVMAGLAIVVVLLTNVQIPFQRKNVVARELGLCDSILLSEYVLLDPDGNILFGQSFPSQCVAELIK